MLSRILRLVVRSHPGTSRAIWLAFAVCLASSCVFAQVQSGDSPPTTTDLTNLSIESLMQLKVTTASKRSETLSECPAAVFVIDSEDIHRYGYRTLAEALRGIVGLHISSDRSFDYIGVRGYSRPGDYNSRVLLLVDGHRVNDPMYGIAPIGEDCPVDIESIHRIEVVKGPGSSLWGTNAVLAVINVITRRGDEIDGGRVCAETNKLFAEYGSAHAGDLDIACSVTGLSSDGEHRLYFPEFDSPTTNYGIAEGIDQTDATRAYVSAVYKGIKLFYNQGKRLKVAPTAPFGTIFGDPRTKIRDERRLLELSYERPAAGPHSFSLLARAYSDEYHYIGDYIYDYPPVTLNRDDYLARWSGGEIKLSGYATDKLFLTCGAEYLRADRLSQDNHDVEPFQQYYSASSTQTTRSLYTQANYEPSDKLSVVLGTRYDDYSTFGGNWSPRGALIYSPSRNTTFKLLLGNAFRAPNSYEVSWQDPELPPTQPETIQTQELVWEQKLGRNSRLVTSLFRFDLRDIISVVETDDSWYITNQGSARSTGFETQFETRTENDVRGFAGFGLTKASFNGEAITHSPDYLVTAGISLPVLSRKYYLSAQIRGIGRLLTRSGQTIEPGSVADLVLATAESGPGTSVSLGIYDLFDKTLYMPAPTELTQDKVPQVGRTVRLQVARRF